MLSSYLVGKLIDKIFKDTDFTVTTPYVSLHSASPASTGANEITAGSEGGSYTRQACSSWDTSLPRANSAVVTFTNTPFIVVTHFGLWDAISGGNFLMGGALGVSRRLFLGEHARFGVGRLMVNCEARFSAYLLPKILDKVLKNTDFNIDFTYMSVHIGDPGSTGANEQSSGTGSRPGIAGGGNWGSPSLNANTWTTEYITSGNMVWTAMPNGTYDYIGFWDASSGGNFLWGGTLASPVTASGGSNELAVLDGNSVFFKMTQA